MLCVRGSVRRVLGTVPDFIDFHIHLPTFLWQLRCFVARIIRKRLLDSFTHNSAIIRLSANSSCVSLHGQRLCQTFLLQFQILYCSDSPFCGNKRTQKPIIRFPESLFKLLISGFNTVLGLSELTVNLR